MRGGATSVSGALVAIGSQRDSSGGPTAPSVSVSSASPDIGRLPLTGSIKVVAPVTIWILTSKGAIP